MTGRAFFARLPVAGRVHLDRDVADSASAGSGVRRGGCGVENGGLERLHGWRHADVALPEFLQRQLHAIFVALGVEGLDEGPIIGDALADQIAR